VILSAQGFRWRQFRQTCKQCPSRTASTANASPAIVHAPRSLLPRLVSRLMIALIMTWTVLVILHMWS